MRAPLAFRPSPEVLAAVMRRAAAAGVDPAGPDFSTWVGDLLASAIPAAVADILSLDAEAPRTGRGASDNMTGQVVTCIVAPRGPDTGSRGDGVE